MENGVNAYMLTLVAIRLIYSPVAISELWDYIHICKDIPKIDGVFNDLDRQKPVALDTARKRKLDILRWVSFVLFEGLSKRL